MDSMLVYRGMDVGTAKPTRADRLRVPHHLLDLVEPTERFTVAMYQAEARRVARDLLERGVRGLAVGGSGLYYRAVVDDLTFPPEDPQTRGLLTRDVSASPSRAYARLAAMDPVAAAKVEPTNSRRLIRALEVAAITGRRFSSFALDWERYPPERVRAAGVEISPEDLAARIRARVDSQIHAGFVEEVRSLQAKGWGRWLTATQAIGYAEVVAHLNGEMTLPEATEATVVRTKRLARRQMAWFRRDPRIRWFRTGREGANGSTDQIIDHLGA